MTHNHASKIIAALGEDKLKAELGWTDRSMRHDRSVGLFSGLWYEPVKRLCDAAGVDCPVEAFRWKEPEKDRQAGAA